MALDQTGHRWAQAHDFPVVHFFPSWDRFGKSAGVARNIEMGKYADRLLAIWDGESRGTKQMIDWMQMYGKPTQVVTLCREDRRLPGMRARERAKIIA